MTWLLLVVGLVLLVMGADLLVKGAARLASNFGVPALVVGLTVVAFGKTIRKFQKDGIELYNTFMKLLIEVPITANPESAKTIASLESDPVLLDQVMKWLIAKDQQKQYKKCIAGLSSECLEVAPAELFHGKHCAECRAIYQQNMYRMRKQSKDV